MMDTSFASAIFAALLHSLWQAPCIALVLWVILKVSRVSSSGKYFLCCAAFFLVPIWAVYTGLTIHAQTVDLQRDTLVEISKADILLADLQPILLWLWCAGVFFCIGRYVMGLMKVRHVTRLGTSLKRNALSPRLKAFIEDANLNTRICIRACHDSVSPCTYGLYRYTILLPAGLVSGLNTREVEAIIAHELAHIIRHDYAIYILQRAVQAALFFNPGLHLLARMLDEHRECAADDVAVTILGDVESLVQALGKARLWQRTAFRNPAMSFFGQGRVMPKRMRRLLDPKPTGYEYSPLSGAGLAVFTCVLALCVPVAASAKSPLVSLEADNQVFVRQAASLDMTAFMADICREVKASGLAYRSEYIPVLGAIGLELRADGIFMNGNQIPSESEARIEQVLKRYGVERGEGRFFRYYSPAAELGMKDGQREYAVTIGDMDSELAREAAEYYARQNKTEWPL